MATTDLPENRVIREEMGKAASDIAARTYAIAASFQFSGSPRLYPSSWALRKLAVLFEQVRQVAEEEYRIDHAGLNKIAQAFHKAALTIQDLTELAIEVEKADPRTAEVMLGAIKDKIARIAELYAEALDAL